MKKALPFLLSLTFLLSSFHLFAQSQHTPYDDCPGIIKSYKPAYQSDYPEWAKMLYQYPVNYKAITASYNQAIKNKKDFRAIHRYYKIWRQQIQPWVNATGEIILPNLDNYYQQLLQSQLDTKQQLNALEKTDSDWTFLGPKETFWLNRNGSADPPRSCPWQVNVYAFDVSDSDPQTLFCGTETGFVNKTTNKGESWDFIGAGYNFGKNVTAVAIHPTNKDIVYISAGKQIHKTVDGGITWSPLLELDHLFHASRLFIDPTNAEKIIAAAISGVFISVDGGESWTQPWTDRAYDIQVDLADSSHLFALTTIGEKFAITESTDGGVTFQIDPNFPDNIEDKSGGLLAATPANKNMILTIMLSPNDTPLLYKKTLDTGQWELVATGKTTAFPLDNGQGYFDLVLGISPSDPDIIFAGTSTLYKSSDGAQSFSKTGGYGGDFAIHPDIQDIQLLADGEIWVSTDGGITYSSDYFTSTDNYEAKVNGIIGSNMWGFDQGWNEDIVVGGRYHNGNTAIAEFYQPKALRMGGAESATGWVLQGKSRHVAFNDLGNGWILPTTAESEPEGRFSFSKYPNMDEYGGRRGNMLFHPNYYGTIYLGQGDGFWRSTDMGITYDLLHDFTKRVRFVQISHIDPNVIYADIVNQGLFRSNDGGMNWEEKPALNSSEVGGSSWGGKTFFVLSPSNPDVIYACLQNGTWSSDIGKIFKSIDGGDSWEDWTGSLSIYTKNMVIQPDENGNDLVYLFSSGRNGQSAHAYQRRVDMADWEPFEYNFPAGTKVNMALPFYRDSKIRVAGNAGVWESPMAEMDFPPIINPWVEKSNYNCMLDTLFFDDHSILNHEGATWHWTISPTPAYLENPDIRNPKVVLGSPGSYDVTLEVTQNGTTYTKHLPNMVTTTTCPSLFDCNNSPKVPKDIWELVYVDSEETNNPGLATMAFDDDPTTIWHTRWSTGSDPYPHEIQINMGAEYIISQFEYLARSNGPNGRIKDYELSFSFDGEEWSDPITGTFVNTAAPQIIDLSDNLQLGQFFRLVALSEVNDNAWTSAAEFDLVGCHNLVPTKDLIGDAQGITAFPVPTSGSIQLTLPHDGNFDYTIYTFDGKSVSNGQVNGAQEEAFLDFSNYKAGGYIIRLIDEVGSIFRIRILKQ